MNKKISDIFDYGADIAPIDADVSFDPARIRALTAKKLNGAVPTTKEKTEMGKIKMKNTKRIILLAAAVLAALMCSAFAFYKFGVIDLILPDDEGAVNYTRISVTGWRSSPEYLAFTEWSAYEAEYNSTHEVPNIVSEDIPIEYQMAGAWSGEMADTLRGILDKYGLKPHGSAFIDLPATGSGIDTDAIFGGKAYWIGGYAYSDGTMLLDAKIKNKSGETVEFDLFNSVKGTFTNISGGMRLDGDYDEWEYTASDGTKLLLGLGGREAIAVADMERVFVVANVSPIGSREELEAAADDIRWTVLNACEGYSAEFYAAYRAEREEATKEDRLACEAMNELGEGWGVTMSVGLTHHVEISGLSSEANGDSYAWVERKFISNDSDAAITVRAERRGDIQAVIKEKLSELGMTDSSEQIENTTVYITNMADGSRYAVWYDERRDIIFTLKADAGELTEESLREQIVCNLAGKDPTVPAVMPMLEQAIIDA